MKHYSQGWADKQVDAIFALEGFEPTDLMKKVRIAIAERRTTGAIFREEFIAYVKQHQTIESFLETRNWIQNKI